MNGVIALDHEQVEAFRVLESFRGAIDVGSYRSLSGTKALLKPPTQVINNWMRNAGKPRKKRPNIARHVRTDMEQKYRDQLS